MWKRCFKLCIISVLFSLTVGKKITGKRSYTKAEEKRMAVLQREVHVNIGQVRDSQVQVGLSLLQEYIPQAQRLIKADVARLLGEAPEEEEEWKEIVRSVTSSLNDEVPDNFKEEISMIHYKSTMSVARVVVEDRWLGLAGEQICNDIQQAGEMALQQIQNATSRAINATIEGLRFTVLELEEEIINDQMGKKGVVHVEIVDGELKKGHTIDQKQLLETTIADALAKIHQAGEDEYQANVELLQYYIEEAEKIVWADLESLFGDRVPFADLDKIAQEVSERLESKACDQVRQKAVEKVGIWTSEIIEGGKCATSDSKPKQFGKCVVKVEALGEHTLEDQVVDATRNTIDRLRQTALEIEKEVINNYPAMVMIGVRVGIVGGELKEETAAETAAGGMIEDAVAAEMVDETDGEMDEDSSDEMNNEIDEDSDDERDDEIDGAGDQQDSDGAGGGTDTETGEEAHEETAGETDNGR